MVPDNIIAELISEFYEKLNAFAKLALRKHGLHHALEPEELVHRYYLRLQGNERVSRDNFMAYSRAAMNNLAIDISRKERTHVQVSIESVHEHELGYIEPYFEENYDLKIALDRALSELRRSSPEEAELVELRAAGFRTSEIAQILGYPYPEWPRFWRKGSRAMRSFVAALEPFTGVAAPRYWPHYPWDLLWRWPEREWPRQKPSPWIIAASYLRRQLGRAIDWGRILLEIQHRIVRRPDRAFYLSDLDDSAQEVRCDSNDMLHALTALTHPPLNLLTMELRNGSVQGPRVRTEEMVSTLRGWHRTKKVSDEAWEEWTSNVWVIWTEQESRGEAR